MELVLTFQASVERPILRFFGPCGAWAGRWALSAGSAATPRPTTIALAKSLRSNAFSIFISASPSLFLGQLGAGCCVGFEVAENELDSRKHHLLHLGRFVKLRAVPQTEVEHTALPVTFDPHHSIIVVLAVGV